MEVRNEFLFNHFETSYEADAPALSLIVLPALRIEEIGIFKQTNWYKIYMHYTFYLSIYLYIYIYIYIYIYRERERERERGREREGERYVLN